MGCPSYLICQVRGISPVDVPLSIEFKHQALPSPSITSLMLAAKTKKDSTTPPKPSAVGKKYRASCDACSTSKVKCSQHHPACHRCINLAVPCNYSVSQRKGKPRGSRRRAGSISDRRLQDYEQSPSPAQDSGSQHSFRSAYVFHSLE